MSAKEPMTNLEATLWDLEKRQWQALTTVQTAIDFYSEFLTEDSLMAVPYGIGDRETVLQAMEDSPVIVESQLRDPQVIKLTDDSGLVVYSMTQCRQGMEPFDAAICTGYVRRDGRWLMAYHQQTPLVAS